MSSTRIAQINQFILRGLGSLLTKEVEFPKECLVTIRRVETSRDLRHASVFLSILPLHFQSEVLRILGRAKRNLQENLGTKLQTKFIPHLRWIVDPSEDHADRLSRILDGLEKSS